MTAAARMTSIFALCAILSAFFAFYDVEAAREAERARIEQITASTAYKADLAAHLQKMERMEAAR